MTLDSNDYETSRHAIAFARAWLNRDGKGANEMFLTVPVDQLPGFCSSLCVLLDNALAMGDVEAGSFFDAMSAAIDDADTGPEAE